MPEYHGSQITFSEDEAFSFMAKDADIKGEVHVHEFLLSDGTVRKPHHRHEAGEISHKHTVAGSIPSGAGF